MTEQSDITVEKVQIALRLPAGLVEGIDVRAKELGLSRNQWMENMTEWVLINSQLVDTRDKGNSETHMWVGSTIKGRQECSACGVLRGTLTPTICRG